MFCDFICNLGKFYINVLIWRNSKADSIILPVNLRQINTIPVSRLIYRILLIGLYFTNGMVKTSYWSWETISNNSMRKFSVIANFSARNIWGLYLWLLNDSGRWNIPSIWKGCLSGFNQKSRIERCMFDCQVQGPWYIRLCREIDLWTWKSLICSSKNQNSRKRESPWNLI